MQWNTIKISGKEIQISLFYSLTDLHVYSPLTGIIPVITEVLGHESSSSTKYYLRVDEGSL